MDTAKVFWSGRSQAIRLPKKYRFDVEEVHIRRRGSALVLEPIAEDWGWLEGVAGALDEDFKRTVEEQPLPRDRPSINTFFR